MAKYHVTTTINGEPTEFLCEPQQTLLDVLRDELNLTGSKEGCASGDCGACSVMVNDRLVCSCLVLGTEAEGAEIETIEGMAATGHPLLEAFVSHQAGQCAYCLAGILMRAKALLASNGATTREQIAAALDDHLCRCGAHPRILDAITSVAHAGNGSDSND